MAIALAEAGADIIGVSRSLEPDSEVEREVTALGRCFTSYACDFADRTALGDAPEFGNVLESVEPAVAEILAGDGDSLLPESQRVLDRSGQGGGVTNRGAFLPWLHWNYAKQDYADRELVLVDSSAEPAPVPEGAAVTVVRCPPGTGVARKRNLAVEAAQPLPADFPEIRRRVLAGEL